jgi:hypothetical protein
MDRAGKCDRLGLRNKIGWWSGVTKQREEGEMNVKWGIMGEGGVKNK